MRRFALAFVALALAACTHNIARDRRSGPTCQTPCEKNQLCYLDGNAAVSLDNPRCELLPPACGTTPTCECLVTQMRMTLCDDTGPWPQVTYYPN